MLQSEMASQIPLFSPGSLPADQQPFRSQLLKWIGNKQRQADSIISYFPERFETYFEPFLGSGGVLGVLSPRKAFASDRFGPLMEIWQTLHGDKEQLKTEYANRYALLESIGKREAYELVRKNYNRKPNGADLLFLCRSCYGGVVRFRKADGHMSTPVGVHQPIPPERFASRVENWHLRTMGTRFSRMDFADAMAQAGPGDMVYCDPPYLDSQSILYGAQQFSVARLFRSVEDCKARGAFVALSIDGTKYSGRRLCDVPVPSGLFEREVFVEIGRSMLKRFQMNGRSLEDHEVSDRLLLTY